MDSFHYHFSTSEVIVKVVVLLHSVLRLIGHYIDCLEYQVLCLKLNALPPNGIGQATPPDKER